VQTVVGLALGGQQAAVFADNLLKNGDSERAPELIALGRGGQRIARADQYDQCVCQAGGMLGQREKLLAGSRYGGWREGGCLRCPAFCECLDDTERLRIEPVYKYDCAGYRGDWVLEDSFSLTPRQLEGHMLRMFS